jgi:C1A family cysteine protease
MSLRPRLTLISPRAFAALCALTLSACDASSSSDEPVESGDESLSSLEALLSDAPAPGSLPDELKADQVFPKRFDLMATQSPVRNQASRGVCSIFSTVALMEHLYMKEGAVKPDFSEQFLQWSVKAELGRFTNTSGSNGSANLEAISRFGVVEESVSPYEGSPWSAVNDAACGAPKEEERPVQCFTNGEPSKEVLEAQRHKLPTAGRWISARVQNIKAFMHENETAVVAGMTFFYQSWNHGRSKLPTNSEYKQKGYVLYPNEEDRRLSEESPAGHSILIVGWDDDLEVPVMDKEGKPALDSAGNPIVERGFFLFKNSWGTAAFGTQNPFGAGYGWLSMRYVEEFGSVVSSRPPYEALVESCEDTLDNNFDGLVDCADAACGESPACAVEPPQEGGAIIKTLEVGEVIPDNSPSGLLSTIAVEEGEGAGEVERAVVSVEISHPYRGDLIVTLLHDGREVVLAHREGRNAEGLSLKVEVPDMVGARLSGDWTLRVEDAGAGDEGTLRAWGLELTGR